MVDLVEACRCQQLGQGWFASLDEVPKQTLSMSTAQILHAREVVGNVPDACKAEKVRLCSSGKVSNLVPLRCKNIPAHSRLLIPRLPS